MNEHVQSVLEFCSQMNACAALEDTIHIEVSITCSYTLTLRGRRGRTYDLHTRIIYVLTKPSGPFERVSYLFQALLCPIHTMKLKIKNYNHL